MCIPHQYPYYKADTLARMYSIQEGSHYQTSSTEDRVFLEVHILRRLLQQFVPIQLCA